MMIGAFNKRAKALSQARKLGVPLFEIQNRRYLGNKYALSEFIGQTVAYHCSEVRVVADLFAGTGVVADIFRNCQLITNDLLFSNYLSHVAWFSTEAYDEAKVLYYAHEFGTLTSQAENYVRANFADTFFSADDCSKIGEIREGIEQLKRAEKVNVREYAILVTSLLYSMDRVANTVGHYDAYRKGASFDRPFEMGLILPWQAMHQGNEQYNLDANILAPQVTCDLLYLDPPYNSRQYSGAYHLLENIARWEKPKVYGVARKMNRDHIKSDYSLATAAKALEDLVMNANARYILLSYNNTSQKGSSRSHAKITDEEIVGVLGKRGVVEVFEKGYKAFTTGKSANGNNVERLFLCTLA